MQTLQNGVRMTVQIALCDDEISELEKTEQLLSAYEQKHSGTDFVIQCFESTDKLLDRVIERDYAPDLIFMDIYMPQEQSENVPMGMKAAKKLCDMGNKAKLIFLTSSKEYALEAFDVEASGYLLKPVLEEKLFSILDKFLEDIERKDKKYIFLKRNGSVLKVSLGDVVYFEAQGKYQRIQMADGTELLQNLTMAKLYEMCLGCREFVRVGISYIINLEHINTLNAQEIIMDNGQKIYLPRGTYRSLREQYFEYYCQNE